MRDVTATNRKSNKLNGLDQSRNNELAFFPRQNFTINKY